MKPQGIASLQDTVPVAIAILNHLALQQAIQTTSTGKKDEIIHNYSKNK